MRFALCFGLLQLLACQAVQPINSNPDGSSGPPARGEITFEVLDALGMPIVGHPIAIHDETGKFVETIMTSSGGRIARTIDLGVQATVAFARKEETFGGSGVFRNEYQLLTYAGLAPGGIATFLPPSRDQQSLGSYQLDIPALGDDTLPAPMKDWMVVTDTDKNGYLQLRIGCSRQTYTIDQVARAEIIDVDAGCSGNTSNFSAMILAYESVNDTLVGYAPIANLPDPNTPPVNMGPLSFRTATADVAIVTTNFPMGLNSLGAEFKGFRNSFGYRLGDYDEDETVVVGGGNKTFTFKLPTHNNFFNDGFQYQLQMTYTHQETTGLMIYGERMASGVIPDNIDLSVVTAPMLYGQSSDLTDAARPSFSWSASKDTSYGDSQIVFASWQAQGAANELLPRWTWSMFQDVSAGDTIQLPELPPGFLKEPGTDDDAWPPPVTVPFEGFQGIWLDLGVTTDHNSFVKEYGTRVFGEDDPRFPAGSPFSVALIFEGDIN